MTQTPQTVIPHKTMPSAEQIYKARQSPLYMAHTKKDTHKLAEEFTAAMLGSLVEPLAEATLENPFDDENESGISLDFLKEEVAAMWGRILAAGHAFDGIKKPLEQAMKRSQNAHQLQQLLAEGNLPALPLQAQKYL